MGHIGICWNFRCDLVGNLRIHTGYVCTYVCTYVYPRWLVIPAGLALGVFILPSTSSFRSSYLLDSFNPIYNMPPYDLVFQQYFGCCCSELSRRWKVKTLLAGPSPTSPMRRRLPNPLRFHKFGKASFSSLN